MPQPTPTSPPGAPSGPDADLRRRISAYPATLTFQDLIRKNKAESALLMWGMAALTVVLGIVIAAALAAYSGAGNDLPSLWPSALVGAAVAAIVAGGACAWSWFGGAGAILAMSGARPLEKRDDPELFNVIDELRIAGGLPMPRIYLIDSPALNAFATGRDPQHAAVAITRGLREQLTRDELQGVMAHEMAHVRHYDIRFAMLMATLVGLIAFACDAFLRIAFRSGRWGGSRRSSSNSGKGGGNAAAAILIVVALVLALIAPLLSKLIQLAVSRQREYLADAGAVELTRNPEGLASALQKLASAKIPVEQANRATAHLYIVNPFRKAAASGHNINTVFSTHPPIQERIARLLALTR